jgi:hypothetical protein
MRFTVTWESPAQSDLAQRLLMLPAADRRHLQNSVDQIDAALRQNAHQKGSLLRNNEPLRFYSAPVIPGQQPVGVVYQVDVDDRLVRVLQLWILSSDGDVSPRPI